MSEGITKKIQYKFSEIEIVRGMNVPQYAKVADGRAVEVKQKTCPVRIALQLNWGPVVLDPFSFAVIPGTDDVVIVGSPTLAAMGINSYDSLNSWARERAMTIYGLEMAEFKDCRRVTLSVDAKKRQEKAEERRCGALSCTWTRGVTGSDRQRLIKKRGEQIKPNSGPQMERFSPRVAW